MDDLRATNPASNPGLMTALTQTLVENQYDLRAMIRRIRLAHLSTISEPNVTNELDERIIPAPVSSCRRRCCWMR